jgi:hypothetical protein
MRPYTTILLIIIALASLQGCGNTVHPDSEGFDGIR